MVVGRYRAGILDHAVAAYAGLVAPTVVVAAAHLAAELARRSMGPYGLRWPTLALLALAVVQLPRAALLDDSVRRTVAVGTVAAVAVLFRGFEVRYTCLQGAVDRCSASITSGAGIWKPARWVGVRTLEPWWYDPVVVLGGFLAAVALFYLDVLGIVLDRFSGAGRDDASPPAS